MFAKIAISGFSEFVDLATTPIKSAVGKSAATANHAGCRKVALITESPGGLAVQKSVCHGEWDACSSSVLSLMQEGRRIVLEGFPIGDIAELCFKHNYRWRVRNGAESRNALRFIIEPGRV